MILIRRIIGLMCILMGIIAFVKILVLTSLFLAGYLDTWYRDVTAYYLAAKAINSQISPYISLNILSRQYLGRDYISTSIPYPPPFLLFIYPLGLLGIKGMVLVWLGLQIACTCWITRLLYRWLGIKPQMVVHLSATLVLLGWYPFNDDVMLGNFSIILLASLMVMWLYFLNGKYWHGGTVLGFLIAVKLLFWLFIPYFIYKRNWRVIISAFSVVLISNILAVLVLGFDTVKSYYLEVGPQTGQYFMGGARNSSIWSLGWRIFSGTTPAQSWIQAPPLINFPLLRWPVSFILVITVCFVGLRWAVRAHSFNVAFGILVTASVLVNPVAWSQYFVFLCIPMAVIIRRLWEMKFPNRDSLLFVGILIFLVLPANYYASLASLPVNGIPPMYVEDGVLVSFPSSLFTIIPLLALVALFCLMPRFDNEEHKDIFSVKKTSVKP